MTSVVAYARSLPRVLAGPLGLVYLAAAAVLAVVAVVARLRGRLDPGLGRGLAWLAIPAGLTALALVAVSHAEPRYMLFPALLGILVGAAALVQGAALALRHAPPRLGRRAPILAAWIVLVVVAGVLVARDARSVARVAPEDAAWIAETGRWIRDDATGPCVVVTTLAPNLSWYSGCTGILLGSAGSESSVTDGSRPTYVVFTTLDGRRKSDETIAAIRALVPTTPVATLGAPDAGAEVFRVSP